jgi:predicted membrane channel-forming protein YqfA (hemolysin III family)
VFITCVVSHLPMLFTVVLLMRRSMRQECVMGLFAVMVSFMYHTCECFQSVLFLSEMHWHRLDNIGAITSVGCSCLHLACLESRAVLEYAQSAVLFIVIILQEAAPWDLRYTVVPVCVCVTVPIASHVLNRRRRQGLHVRRLIIGLASCAVGAVNFVIGLDDQNDPLRVFHGLFHVFIGVGIFFFFYALRRPLERKRSPSQSPRYDEPIAVVVNM